MLMTTLALLPVKDFPAQVSSDVYLQDVFYAVATVCLLFVVAAIGLIDSGLVRRKNVLDTWIQKIVCALVAGLGMAVIGYALWIYQYYQAFAIPSPLKQAIEDYWIGGKAVKTFAQRLDPAAVPNADIYQVYLAFFVAYAMVGGALLHSAGLERVKALPMYVISAIAGTLIIPIALYLTWGSTSPLTVRGVHDYIGDYSLYIVVGVWALIIAWRAGPRLGALTPHRRTIGAVPHDLGLSATGVGVLLFAAPIAFLGCRYIVPGTGYFGISGTQSGFGVALINIFIAYIGGGIGGAIISYRTRNPIMALIGVAAGYIGAGTSMDVGTPLEILLVSFISAFVVYGCYLALPRIGIDDKKVVPLTLGGGLWGALAGGVVGSGHTTGGFFGLTGKYALGVASINLGWQALGVVVIVAFAGITGLIVVFALEKTVGLRITEDEEIRGLDVTYWSAPPSPYVDAPESDSVNLVGVEQVPAELSR